MENKPKYSILDSKDKKAVRNLRILKHQEPDIEGLTIGMKKLIIGILAHVDAGKTTLAEGLLYTCGTIRKAGRVDHGDAFLDNGDMERKRGITIFSKQARIRWKDVDITLLDTPGHVDFSAEMERTLQVLDAAILVIDGSDGVQGDVYTLWRLLKRYEVPVFLFVNKMDQPGTERDKILTELQSKLDGNIVTVENIMTQEKYGEDREQELEHAAMCSEALMEEYLETGDLQSESMAFAVAQRRLFPCFFGSALRQEGIEKLLDGLNFYLPEPEYPQEFGARVYKIGRDTAGNRLTYLKVTGGTLRVKMMIGNEKSSAGEETWEEKADQLRLYNGGNYETADSVPAGEVCAVTGLTKTFAGQGLGYESENLAPVLEPVLTYRLSFPPDVDPVTALGKLRQLEEEEPQLHVLWQEEKREIHMQVMGQVQMEILKNILWERFGLEAEFDAGSIVYKETLAEPVEGIGHFEPLRHYAEVHLLLEPGERGSGLQFASACSEDMLDRNWQRLILTHLEEKRHVGVLTGSEITDLRILLIAGKAHTKHTEGGDFRQATYRAIRQGLRSGKSILLEPWFSYRLEVPTENLGRAMSDITRMNGRFDPPVTEENSSVLTGSVPVATMRDYAREVASYTKGHGRLSCSLQGYEPCHNTEEVMAQTDYDPEADTANPTGSVFCAHGAGFQVPWDQVPEYAHVESGWVPDPEEDAETGDGTLQGMPAVNRRQGAVRQTGGGTERVISREEIEEIFLRTYGKKAEDPHRFRRYHTSSGSRSNYTGSPADSVWTPKPKAGPQEKPEEYLLVDGYNIIFAWPELRELSKINLDSARDKLMDILCNYQGYQGCRLILVYDAYKVKGNPGSTMKYHNIEVVYTKEAETADQYIERTTHELGAKPQKYRVTVATSDALEQMIIWGNGATRMSALGLKAAVEAAGAEYFK